MVKARFQYKYGVHTPEFVPFMRLKFKTCNLVRWPTLTDIYKERHGIQNYSKDKLWILIVSRHSLNRECSIEWKNWQRPMELKKVFICILYFEVFTKMVRLTFKTGENKWESKYLWWCFLFLSYYSARFIVI